EHTHFFGTKAPLFGFNRNSFFIARMLPPVRDLMTPALVITILAAYFGLLILISFITSRGADTTTFFTANRQSPWYLVAFGMIGASLSGVTFISVPGR